MSPTTPAATPASGWSVSARIAPLGDAFLVSVDWRREWTGGTAVNDGRHGSLAVTMRLDDRLPLDAVFLPASQCGGGTIRLEAAIVSRAPVRGGGGRGGGGGRVGASAGPVGSGSTVAAGGRAGRGGGSATAGGGVSGSGTATTGGGRGGAGGGSTDTRQAAIQGMLTEVAAALAGPKYNAEFWLVHLPPGGAEHVQRIATQIDRSSPAVEFPPVPVTTSHGDFRVHVRARLRSVSGEPPRLDLLVMRDIVTAQGVAIPSGTSASGSRLALPEPSEVLSFELPARAQPDVLAGHRFSIRLQVSK
jgi:hypothetical protein